MGAAAVKAVLAPQIARVSQKSGFTGLSLALSDTAAVALAATISLAGNSLSCEFFPGVCTLLAFAALGLYPAVLLNPALEFQRVVLGSTLGYAIATGIMFLSHAGPVTTTGRFPAAWALTILLVLACRALCRALFSHLSWWGTPAVLFGSGPAAHAVFRAFQSHRTGLKIVAAFDANPFHWPELDLCQVHVSTPEYAADFAARSGVSYAIIAMPGSTGEEIGRVLKKHAPTFRHLLVIPGLNGVSSVWAQPCAGGGMLGLQVTHTLLHRGPQALKRAFDLLLTPFVAIAALPLFLIICLAIGVTSGGPVFYAHSRVGRGSSRFKAWKFRTMHPNADQILSECLEGDPGLRAQWALAHKLKNDPRVTLVGSFLRKTSLDELPQLWNVLAGAMSFVGPRPIVSAEVYRYGDCFETYASVRPGITGLWQVSGRNNTTYEERVHFDEYYVRNWSLWLDLYIISRTLVTVLLREGAY